MLRSLPDIWKLKPRQTIVDRMWCSLCERFTDIICQYEPKSNCLKKRRRLGKTCPVCKQRSFVQYRRQLMGAEYNGCVFVVDEKEETE